MKKNELIKIIDEANHDILQTEYTPEKSLERLTLAANGSDKMDLDSTINFLIADSHEYTQNLLFKVLSRLYVDEEETN